jgi:hypothetical protein
MTQELILPVAQIKPKITTLFQPRFSRHQVKRKCTSRVDAT